MHLVGECMGTASNWQFVLAKGTPRRRSVSEPSSNSDPDLLELIVFTPNVVPLLGTWSFARAAAQSQQDLGTWVLCQIHHIIDLDDSCDLPILEVDSITRVQQERLSSKNVCALRSHQDLESGCPSSLG